jgi:hypothetical protein
MTYNLRLSLPETGHRPGRQIALRLHWARKMTIPVRSGSGRM